jgi:DNA gyrase/topoisomerase IV subunit A
LITPDKIEEWLREVEERPPSAATIIRYIANRLGELATSNEELREENIQLRSGRKIEEYESRIANLEYQVELLKRQFGGEVPILADAQVEPQAVEATSLLLFNLRGQVLRAELDLSNLASGGIAASFRDELAPHELPPGLLVTSSHEELLLVFDSGRTETLPVSSVPVVSSQSLDWRESTLQEPRGNEELMTILPIAKMSLFDFCVQASRRGFVKKIKEASLETYIANTYIGTGVRLPPDKTCNLTLCREDDLFVIVSSQGFLLSLEVNRLPLTIEETIRMGSTDFIVTAFVMHQKPSIAVVTHNGKVIHRQSGWLEPASSFKTRGQSLFSKERRESGVHIVGAAPVDEDDWGIVLISDGTLTIHKMGDLFAAGSVYAGSSSEAEVIGFTTYRFPVVSTSGAEEAGSKD